MPQKCPECGAEYPPGESCRARFDHCLALEFENPTSYGAVHHLTVLCYMLQHNLYSREAWPEARALLAQFVEQSLTLHMARRQIRQQLAASGRQWRISKGERMAGFEQIRWTQTIAGVRLDNPEHYCEDVRRWASAVLADTV